MVEVNSDKHSEVSSRSNSKEKTNFEGEKKDSKTYSIFKTVILAIIILSFVAVCFKVSKLESELQLLREAPLKATRRLGSSGERILQDNAEVLGLLDDFSKKLTEVEAIATAADTRVAAIENATDDKIKEVSETNASSMTEIISAIAKRETVIDGIQSDLIKAQGTIAELSNQIATVSSGLETTSIKVDNLTTASNTADVEIRAIINQNDADRRREIDSLERDLQSFKVSNDLSKVTNDYSNRFTLLTQKVDGNQQNAALMNSEALKRIDMNKADIEDFSRSIVMQLSTLSASLKKTDENTDKSIQDINSNMVKVAERLASVESDFTSVSGVYTEFKVFEANYVHTINDINTEITQINISFRDTNTSNAEEFTSIKSDLSGFVTNTNIALESHNTAITEITTAFTQLSGIVSSEDNKIMTTVNTIKTATDAAIQQTNNDVTLLNTKLDEEITTTATLRADHDTFATSTTESLKTISDTIESNYTDLSEKISSNEEAIKTTNTNVAEINDRLTPLVDTLRSDFETEKTSTESRFTEHTLAITKANLDLVDAKTELSSGISQVNETIRTPSFYVDMKYDQIMYEVGATYNDIADLLYKGENIVEIDTEAENRGSFWHMSVTNMTNYVYSENMDGNNRRLQLKDETRTTLEDIYMAYGEWGAYEVDNLLNRTINTFYLGFGLESHHNGLVVNIPEGYDVLTLHLQVSNKWPLEAERFWNDNIDNFGNFFDYSMEHEKPYHPWLCHVKGNWTDTNEALGSWGGNIASFPLVYTGSFEPKKGMYTHSKLNIPTRRSGKVLLYSGEYNSCRITGLSFAKNLHGHAATYPAIFMSAFNGGFLVSESLRVFPTISYYFPTALFNNYLPFFKIPVINTGKEKMIYFTYWVNSYDLIAQHLTPIIDGYNLGDEESENPLYQSLDGLWGFNSFDNDAFYQYFSYVFEAGVAYSAVNDVEINFRSDLSNAISRGLITPALRYAAAKFPAELTAGENWIDFEVNSPYNVAIIEIGTHDADIL